MPLTRAVPASSRPAVLFNDASDTLMYGRATSGDGSSWLAAAHAVPYGDNVTPMKAAMVEIDGVVPLIAFAATTSVARVCRAHDSDGTTWTCVAFSGELDAAVLNWFPGGADDGTYRLTMVIGDAVYTGPANDMFRCLGNFHQFSVTIADPEDLAVVAIGTRVTFLWLSGGTADEASSMLISGYDLGPITCPSPSPSTSPSASPPLLPSTSPSPTPSPSPLPPFVCGTTHTVDEDAGVAQYRVSNGMNATATTFGALELLSFAVVSGNPAVSAPFS